MTFVTRRCSALDRVRGHLPHLGGCVKGCRGWACAGLEWLACGSAAEGANGGGEASEGCGVVWLVDDGGPERHEVRGLGAEGSIPRSMWLGCVRNGRSGGRGRHRDEAWRCSPRLFHVRGGRGGVCRDLRCGIGETVDGQRLRSRISRGRGEIRRQGRIEQRPGGVPGRPIRRRGGVEGCATGSTPVVRGEGGFVTSWAGRGLVHGCW
jgi:hypothetical protein